MTVKAEFRARIEDYCLGAMTAHERQEFEELMSVDANLRKEVQMHLDMQNAILESDILDLREKLKAVEKDEAQLVEEGLFELFDDVEELKALSEDLQLEELINSYEDLPKVHVYQHDLNSGENLHRYYREQNRLKDASLSEEVDDMALEGLEGLEEAVLEKDILSLRDALREVAESVETGYPVDTIDRYLSGELSPEGENRLDEELRQNEALQFEVEMHADIEQAVVEDDVMELRAKMRNVMATSTSWNVSEKQIEEYIAGTLKGAALQEFTAELEKNTDLKAEVELRMGVNDAIGEFDVMQLRAGLAAARKTVDETENKSVFMPKVEQVKPHFWRNSVAAAVIVVGVAAGLNMKYNTPERAYDQFYKLEPWSAQRGISLNLDELQVARMHYQKGEFKQAIDLLSRINADERVSFVVDFYKAQSYQSLRDYASAVDAYSKVIEHGNNLFVEEAEWYKALCYLKMNRKAEATEELIAVIKRDGHYKEDAEAILKRLRFSFK